MKKTIFTLAAIAIIFNLVGCGKGEDEKKKELATPHFKATPKPDPKDYKQPKF